MYIHHLRLYTPITLVYHSAKVNYQVHSFAYTCILIISVCTHILLWYTIPLRLINRCIVLHNIYIHHLRLYTPITLVYHPAKVNYQVHSCAYTCIFIISDCSHLLLWNTIPLTLITRCIVLHIHVYSSYQTVHTYYCSIPFR